MSWIAPTIRPSPRASSPWRAASSCALSWKAWRTHGNWSSSAHMAVMKCKATCSRSQWMRKNSAGGCNADPSRCSSPRSGLRTALDRRTAQSIAAPEALHLRRVVLLGFDDDHGNLHRFAGAMVLDPVLHLPAIAAHLSSLEFLRGTPFAVFGQGAL